MHTALRLSLVLVLVAAAASAYQNTPASDLQALTNARKEGWTGADVGLSVHLRGTEYLWVFGDTIVGDTTTGVRRMSAFPRNTFGRLDIKHATPEAMKFMWRTKDGKADTVIQPQPPSDTRWYWPIAAEMLDDNESLVLSASRLCKDESAFGFHVEGTTIAFVSNPFDDASEWEYTLADVPHTSEHVNMWSGSYQDDMYVYLIGRHDRGPMDTATILGRITRAALVKQDLSSFEYQVGDGTTWSTDPSPDQLHALWTPGISEMNVKYHARLGKYYVVLADFFATNYNVYIRTADAVTGPWSDAQLFYTLPEHYQNPKKYFEYATKSHPEFAKDDEIVWTYVVNSFDFDAVFNELDVYVPRWMRAKLDGLHDDGTIRWVQEDISLDDLLQSAP